MSRPFRTIIIINSLLVLLFIAVNYGIWSQFNSNGNALGFSRWNPFWITDIHSGVLVNGNWMALSGMVIFPNFPFWLFFISTAINLYFVYKLTKDKETKPNPS